MEVYRTRKNNEGGEQYLKCDKCGVDKEAAEKTILKLEQGMRILFDALKTVPITGTVAQLQQWSANIIDKVNGIEK